MLSKKEKMVERLILVDKKKMYYEGIFILRELYSVIDNWLDSHGYEKREIRNSETVKKNGRNVDIIIEPWKKLCDYGKSVIKIKMSFEDIKDAEIERGGNKININQGKVTMIFDAYFETDFEHRWENKPGFFFIRILFDKYIFKPFKTNYNAIVMNDFNAFYNEIQATLNLNKYQ
jgi:hypothetical protein